MRLSVRLLAIIALTVVSGCDSSAPVANVSPTASPASSGAAVPVPRSNASWVFDANTGKFLLFGGNYTTGTYNDNPEPLGDTWTWDGTRWMQLDPTATAPVARFAASAVYDPVRAVALLYGGTTKTSTVYITDTWTWDGTKWSQMGPTQSPPSESNQPVTWDAARGEAVLFEWVGSYPATPVDQTWIWDGGNWKQVVTTGDPPGTQGLLAYDPGRKLDVFFGQANTGAYTWTFDGASWTRMQGNSGTASRTFSMVADDSSSDIVLFGDNGDTWTWGGSKWTAANPAHSPGARRGADLTYDSAHQVVVLFGGSTGTGADLKHHNDIWTWNGTDWTKVSGS